MSDNYSAKVKASAYFLKEYFKQFGSLGGFGLFYTNDTPDIDDSDLRVEFSVEIEARSWGIKSICPVVHSVKGTMSWSIYAEDCNIDEIEALKKAGGTEYRNGKIEGEIMIDSKDWKIKDDRDKKSESITYEEAEIDFKTKIITLT